MSTVLELSWVVLDERRDTVVVSETMVENFGLLWLDFIIVSNINSPLKYGYGGERCFICFDRLRSYAWLPDTRQLKFDSDFCGVTHIASYPRRLIIHETRNRKVIVSHKYFAWPKQIDSIALVILLDWVVKHISGRIDQEELISWVSEILLKESNKSARLLLSWFRK